MKAVKHEIVDGPGDLLLVSVDCPECRKTNEVKCRREGYLAWLEGTDLIQRAMPEVPKELREVLMTGICPSCWEKLFAPEEV